MIPVPSSRSKPVTDQKVVLQRILREECIPLDTTTLDTLARACFGNHKAIRLVRDILDRCDTTTTSNKFKLDTMLTNRKFLLNIASFLMPHELFATLTRVCKKFSWVIRDHLAFSKVYIQMYRKRLHHMANNNNNARVASPGVNAVSSGTKRFRDSTSDLRMSGFHHPVGFSPAASRTAVKKSRTKTPDEEFWSDDDVDVDQRAYDVSGI